MTIWIRSVVVENDVLSRGVYIVPTIAAEEDTRFELTAESLKR